MRRREFITLLSGGVAAWPLAARAQQGKRLPVIAMVYSIGAVAEMAGVDPLGVNMRAFERGLRDLGWIAGAARGAGRFSDSRRFRRHHGHSSSGRHIRAARRGFFEHAARAC